MTRFARTSNGYAISQNPPPTCTVPAGFLRPYKVDTMFGTETGFAPFDPPGDQTISVEGSLTEDLFTDISGFLAAGAKYKAYGLVHKRGYLLYGPPGTGKSTVAIGAARRATEKLGAVAFVVSNEKMFSFAFSMRSAYLADRPAVFLLEEVDDWVDDEDVLGCLDGADAVDNTVFVAMTNYFSKLPPRIANRPGRFDRVEEVAALDQRIQLAFLESIEARVPGGPRVAKELVTAFDGLPVTPAHLREAFCARVILGTPAKTIAKRYRAMFKASKASEDL